MTEINLKSLGVTETILNEARGYHSAFYLARVSFQAKDIYRLLTSQGEIQGELSGKYRFEATTTLDYPAVGDWVLVDREIDEKGRAMIHQCLSRSSILERKVAGDRYDHQIVATNVNTVFVCMALTEDFNIRRLERYLSVVRQSAAYPVIVLMKSDLCQEIEQRVRQVESISFGLDVLVTSSVDLRGYDQLQMYLSEGQTVAFIGSSGIGKSTLINHLLGYQQLQTNEVRADGKGKHTTTHRQLIILPIGGIVIDTPGMKELGLMSAEFETSFQDIEELAKQCKFANCRHESEPSCAILNAIQTGKLEKERFENYKKLQRELSYHQQKEKKVQRQMLKNLAHPKSSVRARIKPDDYLSNE